jgi:hypothetical protein
MGLRQGWDAQTFGDTALFRTEGSPYFRLRRDTVVGED